MSVSSVRRFGAVQGLCLSAAAFLVGCAQTTPSAQGLPTASVPAGWRATASVGADAAPQAPVDKARWWAAFGDPALTAWVEQALKANPSLRAAGAAIAQARALRDARVAELGPAVTGGVSAQRTRSGRAESVSAWRVGVDASWEIDWFGAQSQAQIASEADVRATIAARDQAQVSLAAEVAQTYIDWRGLQARLDVARASLRAQEQTVELIRWRVQAGLASTLDAELARANLEQTRATLNTLQTATEQAVHALAVLTGQAPVSLDRTAVDRARPIPQPPVDWAVGVPAEVLRQRPDIRQAEQRLVAAVARRHQVDAQRYPTLNVVGSLGWSQPRISDLFDAAALSRGLLARLTASLWDGGAADAQVRARDAEVEQLRLGLEQTLLQALREVEDALVALAGDRQRLQHLESAVEAAANAERLADARYSAGLIDYRALLDAQRTLLALQSERAAAQAGWALNHVRLYKALGGDWSREASPVAASQAPS